MFDSILKLHKGVGMRLKSVIKAASQIKVGNLPHHDSQTNQKFFPKREVVRFMPHRIKSKKTSLNFFDVPASGLF